MSMVRTREWNGEDKKIYRTFPDAAQRSENHKDKLRQAHVNMRFGLVSITTRAPHNSTTRRPLNDEIPSCHLSQDLFASRSRGGTPLF